MEKYPDGKLDNTDEGALSVFLTIHEGRLIFDFGKELSWIGFDKKSARALIDLMEKKYQQL